jgi:denticleless
MDNIIYSYDIGTFAKDPINTYAGAEIKSFYIKSCLSPDDKYLLSGSSNFKAYIWNVENPNPVVSLEGHSFEVTSVAWAHHQNNLDGGNMALVTCSDDACHKIWRVGPEEIPQDEVPFLRGNAELNPSYYPSLLQKPQQRILPAKQQFKLLESTPRSLRRNIQQSETTPTTTLGFSSPSILNLSSNSTGRKRTFNEMNLDESDEYDERKDIKRANNETRGRRLFSPIEPSNIAEDLTPFEGTSRMLTTILEELDSPGSNNFQNLSPSPVKRQLTVIKSPEPIRRLASPLIRNDPLLNSPTTNLPNYVLNPRESPHFTNLTSPLRKPKKENLDWLTKIRKQKLLSLSSTMEKTVTQMSSTETENEQSATCGTHDKLKSIENKSETEVKKLQSGKNNKTTILKFFSVKTTTSKMSFENS